MKILGMIVVFLFLLIMNISAADEIENNTKTDSIKIVILGSSTAFGTGPSHPDSAWVNRFRTYLQSIWKNSEVINLAKGGYVTYHILPDNFVPPTERPFPDPKRNITKALSYNPTAIIINLPSNDASLDYSIKEQLQNYDMVLFLTKPKNIPVWVATTQPRNLSLSGRLNLMEMRDSTFTRFENPIDFWTGLAEKSGNIKAEYNSGDGVHLNDAAHKILFERVVLIGAGLPFTKLD
jgi:lysophospholipase L1-like esterase